MPVRTRMTKVKSAISPRKKVECTGNALRPYLRLNALRPSRSFNQHQPAERRCGCSGGTDAASSALGDTGSVMRQLLALRVTALLLHGSYWSLESTCGSDPPFWQNLDGERREGAVGRTVDHGGGVRGVEDAAVTRADDVALRAQLRQDCTAEVGADGAVGDKPRRQVCPNANQRHQVPLVVALPLREDLHGRARRQRRNLHRKTGAVAGGVDEHVAGGDLGYLAGERAQRQCREKESQAEGGGAEPDHPAQDATARGEPFHLPCLETGLVALLARLHVGLGRAGVKGWSYHGTS